MKPYYQDELVTIYHGDCRHLLAGEQLPVDVVVTDPPTEETRLKWDIWPAGWPSLVGQAIKPNATMCCFGSFRMFWERRDQFHAWKVGQDIIWEKHNGSSLHADRFRRVHETCVHFYRGMWADVHKEPQYTMDAVRKTIRRKMKPVHWNQIGKGHFRSEDGGKRLVRSVIYAKSMHGRAENETEKPTEVLTYQIRYSCPPGGVVLDPFCGSGSTLEEAKALGRKCIGIDIREEQCEVAARRVSQGHLLTV